MADADGRLLGICTLRDLVLDGPATRSAPSCASHRPPPGSTTSSRDVAAAAAKYNLVSVPVIDREGVLQGMVTVDDILAEVLDAR